MSGIVIGQLDSPDLLESALTVPARAVGQDAVVHSTQADVCWHCGGEKNCGCALCALPARDLTWQAGECRACLGTGFLTWQEAQ